VYYWVLKGICDVGCVLICDFVCLWVYGVVFV
jgi:hypothetical protein